MKKERYSKLSYSGIKNIKIDRKVAIIAFSIEEVYAIAELVRRQKGRAAAIMGSLSPKTRNSQVGLYQSEMQIIWLRQMLSVWVLIWI